MDKPTIVRDLQNILGFELQPFTGALEDLMRYRYQNHYAVDADENLIGLNLRSNELTDASFQALSQITTLQALNGSENELSEIVLPEDWTALRFLDLSENKNLRCFEFQLPAHWNIPLEWLDLNECALQSLHVLDFLKLKKMDVSRNQLTVLSFRGPCLKLEMLDASNNQLTSFELPGVFQALKYLYLNDNQLETLRFQWDLEALEILHLRNNKLEYLPDSLTGSPRLEALYLHNNPLSSFPKELIAEHEEASSWETVRAYLQSLEATLVLRNDEVKLVLLGNSTAGKSSLLRFLEEGLYDEQLGSTHGIINRIWQPAGRDFKVNVWDFGGQEYYHATHRLFLSNNAVSVVLFDESTNHSGKLPTFIKVYEHGALVSKEIELEQFHYAYWLDNLAYFCRGERPVCLLAQSKMDVPGAHAVPIDQKDKQDYGLPDDTARISVKGAFEQNKRFVSHFEEFQDQLTDLLEQTKGRYDISAQWLEIRTRLRDMAANEPVISHQVYVEICETIRPGINYKGPGVTVSMLDALTNYLRETGVILYYPDIETLADTVFINPQAVADGIYKVFDYSVIQNEGHFSKQQAEVVADRFDPDKMLALMQEFQLIFEVKDSPGDFVAPQYLPPAKPQNRAFAKMETDCCHLAFVLRFPRFLPKSVISRFICEYGSLSLDDYWKNGILFRAADGSDVLVETDGQSLIGVKTNRAKSEQVSEWFRSLRNIIRDHPEVEVSVNEADFVSLPVLLKHPGENLLILSTLGEPLAIETFEPLLGEWEGRRMHAAKTQAKQSKKKVFVSYAHKDDRDYYEKFLDHMRPHTHRDWEIFTDEDIELGENWEERLEKEVQRCDLAILLVSPNFFTSEFIQEKEFNEFIRRTKAEGFKFFSLLFRACLFDQWPELSKTQIFMPLGRNYGFENTPYADKEISFAMLADKGSTHREYLSHYCLDFCKKVEKALNAQPV